MAPFVYPETGVVSFPRFKAGAPVAPEEFYRLLVEYLLKKAGTQRATEIFRGFLWRFTPEY